MCSRTSVSVSRWQSAGTENQRCRTALRVFGFSCCPQDFPSQFFYRGDKSASMERILLRLFAGNSRILRRKSHKLNIWNGTRRLRLLSMSVKCRIHPSEMLSWKKAVGSIWPPCNRLRARVKAFVWLFNGLGAPALSCKEQKFP